MPVNCIEALTNWLRWMPLFNEEFGHNPSLLECAEHLSIYPVLVEGCLPTAIVDRALIGPRTMTRVVRLMNLLPVMSMISWKPFQTAFSGSRQRKTSLTSTGSAGRPESPLRHPSSRNVESR